MLELLKVSITGELSSGKTETCQIFQELGAFVISADKVSHSLLVPHTHIGCQIIDLLGSEIVTGGSLNSQVIAEKVFKSPLLLKGLESILHPEVCRIIEEQYNQTAQSKAYPLFVAEVPLLYEIHYAGWFDRVILIAADEDVRRKRFIKKTGFSEENFYQRCSRFSNFNEKAAQADVVIENNGTKKEFHQKIEEYFYALKGAL
ncbi:dephospho-CoA kinase [Chlamydia sp. 17-3921]|uniref:dephospho-CoA kinase n=1 Tax=Chlamydia sp. 17-3921 TaxID=2675798 RepID=UPI00191AC34D|nr:dephospho-CoA kinase [Chlamydia sp. 17-3921]